MPYDKTYTDIKNVFGAGPEEILKKYYKRINNILPVLDVGAGQGRNSFFLARSGLSVDAIDPSSVSIKTIEDMAKKENLKISTYNKNIEEFEPKYKFYSAILIFGLLQILNPNSIDKLLKFISQFTQEKSLIFITAFSNNDPSFEHYKNKWTKVEKHSFSDNNGKYRTFFEINDLLKLFANFKVIHQWEGLGKKHQHGNSPIEQHAMIELVLEKL